MRVQLCETPSAYQSVQNIKGQKKKKTKILAKIMKIGLWIYTKSILSKVLNHVS